MQQTGEIAETNSSDNKLRVNPEVRGQESECPVIKTTEKSQFQWWGKEVICERPIKLIPLTFAYQQSRKAESIKKMNERNLQKIVEGVKDRKSEVRNLWTYQKRKERQRKRENPQGTKWKEIDALAEIVRRKEKKGTFSAFQHF